MSESRIGLITLITQMDERTDSVKSLNPCLSAIQTVMDDYEKILDELNEELAA